MLQFVTTLSKDSICSTAAIIASVESQCSRAITVVGAVFVDSASACAAGCARCSSPVRLTGVINDEQAG